MGALGARAAARARRRPRATRDAAARAAARRAQDVRAGAMRRAAAAVGCARRRRRRFALTAPPAGPPPSGPAVVDVLLEPRSGPATVATGFHSGDGRVVTVAHLLPGRSAQVRVRSDGGRTVRARPVRRPAGGPGAARRAPRRAPFLSPPRPRAPHLLVRRDGHSAALPGKSPPASMRAFGRGRAPRRSGGRPRARRARAHRERLGGAARRGRRDHAGSAVRAVERADDTAYAVALSR